MESSTFAWSRNTAWAMSEENVKVARCYLEEHLPPQEQIPAWVAGFWEPDGDYYP
jgi:hypothetical protein